MPTQMQLAGESVSNMSSRNLRILLLGGVLLLVLQVVIILMVAGIFETEEAIQPFEPSTALDAEARITKSFYGRTANHQNVYKYTLVNEHSMQLDVISLGGTIMAIKVPDKNGVLQDVTLGYQDKRDYLQGNPAFFGALVGRVANRISRGRFTLDGATYQLDTNNGPNHLHGGSNGWDKAVWEAGTAGDSLVLTHYSPDGDMNYPGDVKVKVIYRLTDDNEVHINFTAQAKNKATPINLTSHPYFNLAGAGNSTIKGHVVMINADRYIPTDSELIPTGAISPVYGTAFDLRKPTRLGDVILNVTGGTEPGYDHCFCINGPTGRRLAATIHYGGSGIGMSVFTNQPGLQFYTGNFLNVTGGKHGGVYRQHTGFCMETENYPDAINHNEFPDSVLRPGPSTYEHQVWYKFYTMEN